MRSWFLPAAAHTLQRKLRSGNNMRGGVLTACKGVGKLLFIFSVATCSFAQDAPDSGGQTKAAAPEKVQLSQVSSVEVASLPAESIGAPLLCDPDGRVLFRLAMPDTGIEDPLSVSTDGKTVIRFGREKINDISNPAVLNAFLGGSDVYMLVRGRIPLGHEIKWRTPTGEIQTQQAAKSSFFVARFGRDGMYAGSVPLDLSFKPLQIGVFPDGEFLIAGADPVSSEPRLGIVDSKGQLRRLIELEGDVSLEEGSAQPGKEKDPTALPRSNNSSSSVKSLRDVVYTSHIASDGASLLLFRPINGPIFSIFPSGEVRVHKLNIKGAYRLYTIKASRNSWIVEFIHDVPNSNFEEFSTYAFDPETGVPLREYFFPGDLGWGLACTDGDEFTFIMASEETHHLKFVTLAPQRGQ